jgi:hypothetical protein
VLLALKANKAELVKLEQRVLQGKLVPLVQMV